MAISIDVGTPRDSSRRPRIVLAEDDALINALIAEILAELGHDVCAITLSEDETVEAGARHTPDLMLVDAQLQAGSGVAAMEAILRQGAMAHIFMTGGTRHTVPPQAFVLHKPFAATDLKALLNEVEGQMAAMAASSLDV